MGLFAVWVFVAISFLTNKEKVSLNTLLPVMLIPPCLVAGGVLTGQLGIMMTADTVGLSGGMDPGSMLHNFGLAAFGSVFVTFLGTISTVGSWLIFFSSFRKIAHSFVQQETAKS